MIGAYRKLWQDRNAVGAIETQQQLEQQILIELMDELTHPRVRKTPQQKLDIALQRITESSLSPQEKIDLSNLYKKIAAHIE